MPTFVWTNVWKQLAESWIWVWNNYYTNNKNNLTEGDILKTVSDTTLLRKKKEIRVLPTGVEPTTFHISVRRSSLRPGEPGHITNYKFRMRQMTPRIRPARVSSSMSENVRRERTCRNAFNLLTCVQPSPISSLACGKETSLFRVRKLNRRRLRTGYTTLLQEKELTNLTIEWLNLVPISWYS